MIKDRALKVSSVEMVLTAKADRSIPYNGNYDQFELAIKS